MASSESNFAKNADKKLSKKKENLLVKQLKVYSKRAKVGEGPRIAADRKGYKLREGKHFEQVSEGTSPVVVNFATGLYERLINSITRNKPSPQIVAKQSNDTEGAMLLQAGVLQIWDTAQMTMWIKRGALLAGFCRPALHYVYWNRKLRGGIGDVDNRVIPPYRCIIDNRFSDIGHMEYKGFWEEMTRKELIELFPEKADEIEEAQQSSNNSLSANVKDNPFKDESGGDNEFEPALTRISPTFTEPAGTYSINSGTANAKKDPTSEKVRVEFLWLDDGTPIKKEQQKVDGLGRPIMMFIRHPLTNEIMFEEKGNEVVHGPFGPLNFPNVEPQMEPVMETVIENKYKYSRHVAWLPEDDIVLWDVSWDGPIPLITQRDSYAMDGYWSKGLTHRLIPLQNAYNMIESMIKEKLQYNLHGTWLATPNSGLKTNKLIGRAGQVFQAFRIGEQDIRSMKMEPIDPIFPQMLSIIESQMQKILGVSNVMQGEAAGRIDDASTYDKLLENASGAIVDIAQMIEQTAVEWCNVVVWFMQTYYTHEHMVEIDTNDEGGTEWKPASAILTQGEYSIKMSAGSMIYQSESQQFARYSQYATMGFYALPTLGRLLKIPFFEKALAEKGRLLADPSKSYLLGPAAATPAKTNTATQGITKRSHHAPGR